MIAASSSEKLLLCGGVILSFSGFIFPGLLWCLLTPGDIEMITLVLAAFCGTIGLILLGLGLNFRKRSKVLALAFLLVLVCQPIFAQNDSHGQLFQKYQAEGIKLLQAKDYASAVQKFEAALKEHLSWQTWHNIAICHSQLGDNARAVADEQRSIEAGGLHANQCITMAGALEGLGQPKQALAWLDLACSVEPAKRGDPGVQGAIQRLHDPTVNPTGSAIAPDYLAGLTSVHRFRQQDLPLKVYVRKNSQIPEFYDEFVRIVRDSMNQWCQASNGEIFYKFVNDRQNANIVWDYTDRRELISSDHEPGLWAATEMKVRSSDNSQGDGTIVVLVRTGPHASFLDRSLLMCTALHEMGHALGMHGHSSNPNDVMFLAAAPSPITKLSQRDINTIRRLYPDLQMQGFAYVRAGNYPKALDCFTAALKERPNSWIVMQSIANCQQGLGHYSEAIDYYLKSIQAGGVHGSQCRNIAAAYEGNGQPDKALFWLEKGCSIDPAIANDPNVKATMKNLARK